MFVAKDRLLGRQVALKVLMDPSPQLRTRVLREARAMAQLSHNHIVRVFDVGEFPDGVYISMEYVEGGTLSDWLARKKRSTKEVIELMTGVAAGLAAAHERGFVHRDFKPANLLVGADGRALIADFGLVSLPERRGDALDHELPLSVTQSEHLLGTPAYMALEQLQGEEADATSDQYGFCVTLYEAIYGSRPFPADTVSTLVSTLQEGERVALPPSPALQRRVRGLLTRGLAASATDRYSSMKELLVDLSHKSSRNTWFVGGAIALFAASILWFVSRDVPLPRHSCIADRGISEQWDERTKAQTLDAFRATNLVFASAAFATVDREITARDDLWRKEWEDSCQATRVRGGQSETVMQSRMNCLERRRRETTVLIDILRSADAATVEAAPQAVQRLPSVDDCADILHLAGALPAEKSKDYEQAEQAIAQAAALHALGRYLEAEGAISKAVELVEPLGDVAFLARALAAQARAQRYVERYDEALVTIRRATRLASEINDPQMATRLWIERAVVQGKNAEIDEALVALDAAAEALVRAGETPELRWQFEYVFGATAMLQSDYEEARVHLARALTVAEENLSSRQIADTQTSMAAALQRLGEYELAIAAYTRSLEILEQEYGLSHPKVAGALEGIGSLERRVGNFDKAQDHLERALSILDAVSATPRSRAGVLYALGNVHVSRGDLAMAATTHRRALRLYEAALPEEHPAIARALTVMAKIARLQGELEEARTLAARALQIKEAVYGPDHMSITFELTGLAYILAESGDIDGGREQLLRVLAIRIKALGPDHPRTAGVHMNLGAFALEEDNYALARKHCARAAEVALAKTPNDGAETENLCLGEAELGLGRTKQAVRFFRDVVLSGDRRGSDPYQRARARFGLAQALAKTNRADSRENARLGRDLVAQRSDPDSLQLSAEITRWLGKERVH